ncbi:epithelial-stromal interaction protein 1 isoform X4 [Mustela putorius furo]|uniref:Epithelial-stromal interaction protein 1 isoform X4 n=1 Tax=Mustela putorius furo TaxID=9669 RepID=A0A8U0NXX8_MUSPF|nr:epithelial-stromal interaction protein 1 isoform X4 [Mustela putorius furo]
MFTRTPVVGSGLSASPAPRLTRDLPGRPPEPGRLQGPRPGLEVAPQSPARESRGLQSQRVPGAYTMIVPNENRRNQIKRSTYIYSVNIQNASRLLNRVGLVYLVAEQELESLEKWKEQHRAKPVNLAPRRLGGSQSEAEVRQKQQLQLMQSKYQQKSNKLEEKKRLQENLRREAFREHRQYKTAEFLSRLAAELPDRSTHQIALHDPQSSTWKLPVLPGNHSWARSRAYKDSLKEEENKKLQKMKEEQHQKSELLEFKRQQQEEERTKTHQAEHRRVNNVFLDRLQGKSQPGGFEHFGGHWNTNSGNSWDV